MNQFGFSLVIVDILEYYGNFVLFWVLHNPKQYFSRVHEIDW
jgi:hypothetical protein